MTICIGIICDKSKKAVATSDRMLTGADVQFEHPLSKIDSLSPSCVAMTAGSALIHTDLFRSVIAQLGGRGSPSVQDVVQAVKAEFIKVRRSLIEEQYFLPRGFDIAWFNENQQTLKDDTSFYLDSQLEEFELNLEILIAGVDQSGAPLYVVSNPGQAVCYDSLGFATIGIGSRHADTTFIDSAFTSASSLSEALYIGFKAKKRAERAPGVGVTTDIVIIDRERSRPIRGEALELLQQMHQKETECLKGLDIPSMLQKLMEY